MNVDTTDIQVDKSSDGFAQQQTFSGDRGKGHCYLFSNVTCSSGSILAVTPGPNVSCSPRGGDGVSLGVHLARAEEEAAETGVPDGMTNLMDGVEDLGVAMVADRGYIYRPRVNTGSNPTLLEYCERHDILALYKPMVGEMALVYNPETDLFEQIQNNPDPTLAANTGRVITFLRPGSEQTHTFKNQFKNFGHRVHNSRLNAVGVRKLAYYNQLFGKSYGAEWAEMSKLNIEYLVMCGRFNEWHPKFPR